MMPVALLEAFTLSRLGKLTVKDIASGTGASEANVKVRVHRAKEMLGKMMKCGNMEVWKCGNGEMRKCGDGENGEFCWAAFRAVMMLAAVDGAIAKEELALYRELAERMRGGNAAEFDELWAESVKGMAYIGFLSDTLEPEELVCEFVREVGKGLGADDIAMLERMAVVDGFYSRIERDCVSALAKKIPRLLILVAAAVLPLCGMCAATGGGAKGSVPESENAPEAQNDEPSDFNVTGYASVDLMSCETFGGSYRKEFLVGGIGVCLAC